MKVQVWDCRRIGRLEEVYVATRNMFTIRGREYQSGNDWAVWQTNREVARLRRLDLPAAAALNVVSRESKGETIQSDIAATDLREIHLHSDGSGIGLMPRGDQRWDQA